MNKLSVGLPLGNIIREKESIRADRGKKAENTFDYVMKENSKKPVESKEVIKDKKPIKTKSIVVEEVIETEVAEPEVVILGIIAEYLQIPLEQLQEKLMKLEINAMELLDKENFVELLSEVYGQSVEEILMNNTDVKEIGKLWEQLESIQVAKNQKDIEGQENNTSLEEGLEIVGMQTEAINNGSLLKETQILDNGEVKVLHKQNSKETSELNSMQVSSQLEKEALSILGLKIPIETFSQGEKTRMWEQFSQTQLVGGEENIKTIDTQILTKLEVHSMSELKEIHMDLAPKELGKLSFKLVENNGVFTAQVQVDNEKTKELLLQNIQALKEGLEKQGMMISGFEVNVRDEKGQSHMQRQKQKATKRIEEIMAKHLLEIEEERREITQISEVDLMV